MRTAANLLALVLLASPALAEIPPQSPPPEELLLRRQEGLLLQLDSDRRKGLP